DSGAVVAIVNDGTIACREIDVTTRSHRADRDVAVRRGEAYRGASVHQARRHVAIRSTDVDRAARLDTGKADPVLLAHVDIAAARVGIQRVDARAQRIRRRAN